MVGLIVAQDNTCDHVYFLYSIADQGLIRAEVEVWPVEIVAFLSTLALLLLKRRDRSSRHAYLIAVACYAGMLADFFVFNRPVNEALSSWTPATLPADWSNYRIRWEIGHALTALFSVIAFVTLIRQHIREGAGS